MLNVRYLGSVKGLCPMATVVWILGQKGLESSYRCEGPAYVEIAVKPGKTMGSPRENE